MDKAHRRLRPNLDVRVPGGRVMHVVAPPRNAKRPPPGTANTSAAPQPHSQKGSIIPDGGDGNNNGLLLRRRAAPACAVSKATSPPRTAKANAAQQPSRQPGPQQIPKATGGIKKPSKPTALVARINTGFGKVFERCKSRTSTAAEEPRMLQTETAAEPQLLGNERHKLKHRCRDKSPIQVCPIANESDHDTVIEQEKGSSNHDDSPPAVPPCRPLQEMVTQADIVEVNVCAENDVHMHTPEAQILKKAAEQEVDCSIYYSASENFSSPSVQRNPGSTSVQRTSGRRIYPWHPSAGRSFSIRCNKSSRHKKKKFGNTAIDWINISRYVKECGFHDVAVDLLKLALTHNAKPTQMINHELRMICGEGSKAGTRGESQEADPN